MDDDIADEIFASAVKTFIDCLPRPIVYAPHSLSPRIQQIVVPRASVFVIALDRREQTAFASVARIAKRTGIDGIALSRNVEHPDRLRFDLFLRRHMQSATFMNYAFREAGGSSLFMPVNSGRLVHLGTNGLTPREEVYFKMASGELAAIDRAASRGMMRYFESS